MAITRTAQFNNVKMVRRKVKKKIVKIPKWCRWVDCSKEGYIIFNSKAK